jgi:hypothetical protein
VIYRTVSSWSGRKQDPDYQMPQPSGVLSCGVPGKRTLAVSLITDDNPGNGWTIPGSLPGQGGKIAVWAEVELEGELLTTPLLPLAVE